MFARGLAGKLYDKAATAQGLPPGAGCAGLQACFGDTFRACSLLCLAGSLCSVSLALRTRGPYLELGRELAEEDEERATVLRAASEAAARAAAAAAHAAAHAAAAAASPSASAAQSHHRHHRHHHPRSPRHHPRSHALERTSIF